MSIKKNVKKGLVKGLKAAGKAERKVKKGIKKSLGMTKEPPKPKPYVHPWTMQNLGTPKIVDEIKKPHCCGCQSCYNICPVGAIAMEPDSEGFLYPKVDHETCIDCGKCVRHCPIFKDFDKNDVIDTCYAIIAEDDQMRLDSSSGGLFTLFAQPVIENGGAVCGATFNDDHVVVHAIAETMEELRAQRKSKYVQSSTEETYKQVEKMLKEGREVLYSGCPCQIAGLYAYLGKEYDNLFTVDLVCHGVPSPGLFQRYLDEDYAGGKDIDKIDFRDKSVFGWSTHMNIYFNDGSEKHEVCTTDAFYIMFLRCLAQRPFCSICKFTTLPRVADVSIGDWWGIEKYDATLNDRKGTSLLLVNNEKGQSRFEAAKKRMRECKEFPLSDAIPRNYTINKPFRAHPNRERFFELLEYYPFDKAVFYALNHHFDIGLFGLWYGENYGSLLTYFGLRSVLRSLGYSSLMIFNPHGKASLHKKKYEPLAFARRCGYQISKWRPLSQMRELNESVDAFMVGSDQLWNPGLSKPYGHSYFLSFAGKTAKRIAYGTSFGKAEHKLEDAYGNLAVLELSRFDAISVRDDFSKDTLAEYGIDAVKVLDPALLCEKSEYMKLVERAGHQKTEEPQLFDSDEEYIFVYLLDPNANSQAALEKLATESGKKVYVTLDMGYKRQETVRAMFEDYSEDLQIAPMLTVEQWLKAIYCSKCVLTDSFHGTLFAYILDKDFVALPNIGRGSGRFYDVLEILGLENRIIEGKLNTEMVEEIVEKLNVPIDFLAANKKMEPAKELSLEFIRKAMTKPKVVPSYKAFDLIEVPYEEFPEQVKEE